MAEDREKTDKDELPLNDLLPQNPDGLDGVRQAHQFARFINASIIVVYTAAFVLANTCSDEHAQSPAPLVDKQKE